jgi:two-component system, cell cycle sensor histidine kinase and response regulator CckA
MSDKSPAQLESEITLLREQVSELQRQLAIATQAIETQASGVREDNEIYSVISEREKVLLEAERIAHTGSWVWNIESNQVYWSDELYRILGYKPELTTPSIEAFFAVVHDDDVESVRAMSSDATRTGITPRIEIRISRQDGSVRTVQMAGASVYDANGQLRRIVGTVWDVTDIREFEKRLLRANQMLEEAQSLAHIGSWSLDFRTQVVEWSAEFMRILDITAEVPASFETYNKFVHPDDLPKLKETQRKSLQSPGRDELDIRIIRPDGEIRYVRNTALAVTDENGKPIALRGTMQDFTDMRHLRERLYAAERLEAIGRLAGGIAHDFNNLMMIVQGNLEMLNAPERPELKAIFDAVKSAKTLTTSLLAFGRKTPLQRQVIELNELVGNTAKLLRRLIESDIELKVELSSQPLWVDVDSSMFQQVLINLVINARDAMRFGGSIVIASRAIQQQAVMLAELIVRDTGAGIDPEIKGRIFEPFFTTKALGAGSGMGLAMVHGTVLQHGGTIDVETERDTGTAFVIRIPTVAKTVSRVVPESLSATKGAGASTVLVVDDQPEIGELVTAALKRGGYTVLAAVAPSQALALAREHPEIQLALCDLVMPEMHGTALAVELKKLKPDLAIVFMSGYSGESAGIPHGAKLLQKPFSLDELIAAIGDEISKVSSLTR